MFNLSVFDALTDDERIIYNGYTNTKASKEYKNKANRKLTEMITSFIGVREIPIVKIYKGETPIDSRVIAGFENECVHLSESFVYDKENPKNIPFIKEVVILDVPQNGFNVNDDVDNRYEIILKQIIDNGLLIGDNKYIFYASSTNQQKNRQACLLEKSFYEKNEYRLMCGLTLDIINKTEINGNYGCNTGKFLAYSSLIFSKSVEPSVNINIDEVIVLPEFETLVTEKINYLSIDDCTVEEKTMDVPVNHMDGAGFFLPGVLPASAQIRGGYIKGCVFPFDFRRFIIEKQKKGIIKEDSTIKDVWGDDISIDYIRDNIKLVLNGSQLKMWKYYKSWAEYKSRFKESGLKICINNMLHYSDMTDPIVLSAYQFYHTIPRENVTDKRIEKLSELTIEMINDAKTNPDAALKIMGIDLSDEAAEEKQKMELDPLYASIKAYPELLQTPYVRKRIDSKIKSIRKKAMGGKPYIRGYYNYICPDLYAACEYWFCNIDNPKGVVPKNYVYNGIYSNDDTIDEVCCLRSPHLSDCEHGMRKLIHSKECDCWFNGADTVISTHDLLIKTLQADVDGDEMLITPDKAFINMVDRNKLPLYYEMAKADATPVTKEAICKCLKSSFRNSKIGSISNVLTKYLNMAKSIDTDFIRILTAYNNYCIDFPKSQVMPELNSKYEELFREWQEMPYPKFFQYAKDKKSKQCCCDPEIVGRSNVNRISEYIRKKTAKDTENIWKFEDKMQFDNQGKFNPRYLQISECKVVRTSEEYSKLVKLIHILKLKGGNKNYVDELNKAYKDSKDGCRLGYDVFYHYCSNEILNVFSENYKITELIGIRKKATAYLLDIEYFQKINADSNKDILWNCFGDILYDNLMINLKVDKPMKVSRMAYQSNSMKMKKVAEQVESVMDEKKKSIATTIYQQEYDWIMNMMSRKNCQHDRYLLYILLVLYKRKQIYMESLKEQNISADSKEHIKIYKNKKSGHKVTMAMIDKWMDKRGTARGLERLTAKKYIRIIECEGYYKVYLQIPDCVESMGKEVIVSSEKNPMIDYYEYTKERKIAKCAICPNKYIIIGNTKTCSVACSKHLKLINKNTCYNTDII